MCLKDVQYEQQDMTVVLSTNIYRKQVKLSTQESMRLVRELFLGNVGTTATKCPSQVEHQDKSSRPKCSNDDY